MGKHWLAFSFVTNCVLNVRCFVQNSKSIYSNYPDFTFCFQYTILKWIPCFVLWLVAPFWTYMLTRTIQFRLKFSLLSFLKMASTSVLIVMELYHLVMACVDNKYIVHYMTPLIQILTYVNTHLFTSASLEG